MGKEAMALYTYSFNIPCRSRVTTRSAAMLIALEEVKVTLTINASSFDSSTVVSSGVSNPMVTVLPEKTIILI